MIKNAFFWLIGLLVSALMVCGFVVIAEITYRATGYNPNRGALIDANLFPNAPYTVSTQPANVVLGKGNSILDDYFGHDECDAADGATARFNSLGFRGAELPSPGSKKPNEVRVVVTGGSASVSWNIGERCTLDWRLKERLERLLPGAEVRVVNLGSGAWKSFQELIAVQLHALDLEPDVVVHFSGFNDSLHSFYMPINQAYSAGTIQLAFDRYRDWLYGTPGQFLSELRMVDALRTLMASAPAVLSGPAHAEGAAQAVALPETAAKPAPYGLATALHLPLDLEAIARRTDFDPLSRQVVDNYVRNERLMARAVAVRGATLLSALQPTLYLKQPLSPAELRMMTDASGYGATVNFTVQNYLRLRQDLADLSASEPNVVFQDLSAAFDGLAEEMFGDNVHFYKQGYAIVADRLAPTIASAVRAKRPTLVSGGP